MKGKKQGKAILMKQVNITVLGGVGAVLATLKHPTSRPVSLLDAHSSTPYTQHTQLGLNQVNWTSIGVFNITRHCCCSSVKGEEVFQTVKLSPLRQETRLARL